MFVNVSVAAQPVQAALAVRTEAVHTVDGASAVFVRNADGFVMRPVTTGRSDGRMTEILAGLSAGAQYAARGSFAVKAELGKSGNEHAH
jgi:cobalt-zinc-cadmium efflux system membrane fusion protein